MRMLGSVVGMALSTAIQFAVMKSALAENLPRSIYTEVISGRWEIGQENSKMWEASILDAKMKGIHAVFTMLVPLVGVCFLGCYFIPDKELPGDSTRHSNEMRREQAV